MTTDCRCGRPTRDEAYACEHCGDQLAQALAEIPWLDTELERTLAGQRGVDYRTLGGARTTEHPLPLHLGASAARQHLRGLLVSWVKFCTEEEVRHQSPKVGLPFDHVSAMSRWLLWRIDGLLLHELGSDAVDQLTSAVAHCRRVIDRPADRWFAGPCDQCQAPLYVTPGAATVKCRGVVAEEACDNLVDVAGRREALLAEAEDRLATAVDVARAVSWLGAKPLTAARVRQWAVRARIYAKGHDGARPLYRIGDAIDLLAADTKVAQ